MGESAERFIKIPDTVKRMKGLSDGAKLLYGELLALTQAKGFCFATNLHLAKEMNKSVASIGKMLIELEKASVIWRDVSPKGGRAPRKIYVGQRAIEEKAKSSKMSTSSPRKRGVQVLKNEGFKSSKTRNIIDNIIDNIINNPSTPYREVIHNEELLPNTIPLRDEKPIVTTMQDIEQADRDYLKKQQQIMASQLNLYREKGTAQ